MFCIKRRERDSHKGNYGRVGILAGSRGMTGSAYLTCMASLKIGSGLVYSIVAEDIFDIMSIKLTEAIIIDINDYKYPNIESIINDKKIDVLVIGPGMGISKEKIELTKNIVENLTIPIVIDADGINCLSYNMDSLKNNKGEIILTPHPKEMSRLIGKEVSYIQKNREKITKDLSMKYKVYTVLKGSKSVVSTPKGKIYINKSGNPGMSTAGTGDVLTGMIGGLIGQGYSMYESCVLGVFIHGLAGDIAVKDLTEYSLVASDLIDNIPKAIRKLKICK